MRVRTPAVFMVVAAGATALAQVEAPRPKPPATAAAPAAAPAQAQAQAQAAAPAPRIPFSRDRYRIPHKVFTLDNGLRLIVHEDHSAPVVAVNLWYHVGSRNEQRGKTGFAHLFEHFFFNGSEHHPSGFREAMDDLGANNRNGTTSNDRTNFFENVPVSALERTLFLEADRMGFLAARITKESLERERGVVQNEKRQGENQPYAKAFSRLSETLYPMSHPYSWSTIGSMEDLNAASLDDVKEWYRTYYGPDNCVLSLAGDITPERALELVKKYFNGIPPGPPLRRADQWIPRFERHLREEAQDRVPQPLVFRTYHVPGWGTADADLLSLAGSVLSGSKSARLDRRLIYDKGLVTSITAGVDRNEIAGTFDVQALVKAGTDPALVEKEIDAVLKQFLAEGPTAAELQRAQSRALANFVRGIEALGGFGGRADVLAESLTYADDAEAYLDRLERMATATPAQVKAAAVRWLDAAHYTMVVRPFPALTPGPTTLDRKVVPPLGEAPAVTFPAVQRTTLKNGLKVVLLERHATPIVNVALAVDAGYAADEPAKAGLAALALNLLDDGTRTRDAFRIVDELDALGARVTTRSTLDLSLVRLQALPANLAPSLQLMADVVLNPVFPADLVTLEKRRQVSQIGQEQADPRAVALRVLPRLLYGTEHAYGKPFTGSGEVSTVETITRDDLLRWHRTWFAPDGSTLIVTGDVTMAQLEPALNKAFGGWARKETPAKSIGTVAKSAGGKVYLIDQPDAPQSIIVAAHVTERGGSPQDLAMETVMRNFGGMSTSRLNRNLRLDKHWSYGSQAAMPASRGPRPFYVVAPVQTDKTKEAIVEVVKELRGVAGERPIAGEEFRSIMRNQTLGLPGRFDTLDALERAALDIVSLGYPDDYYAKYATSVRALDEQALADAAKRFIRPDEVVWLIVGDLAKVEAGIRELKLGEVTRLDTSGKSTDRGRGTAEAPGAPAGGPAPAQATPPVPPLVREGVTEKISAHVHVIPDDGVSLVPNVGIVVGSKATLVIDTGLGTRNGATVMREVAKISRNADLYLITTHVHPEHDLGTGGFPATVKMIRSKDQVDEIAASGLEMAKRFSGISPLHAELLQGAEFRKADIVFEKEHTLDLGGVSVKFLAMGFNHTRGDTATFVEPDKVLFSGDVAMAWLPSVGNGASLNQWITSQDRFLALQPSKVVPSHGPMGDASIMTKYKAFISTLQTRAAELKKAGRTLDETLATLQAELGPTYGVTPRMVGPIRAAYNQAP